MASISRTYKRWCTDRSATDANHLISKGKQSIHFLPPVVKGWTTVVTEVEDKPVEEECGSVEGEELEAVDIMAIWLDTNPVVLGTEGDVAVLVVNSDPVELEGLELKVDSVPVTGEITEPDVVVKVSGNVSTVLGDGELKEA